MPDQPDDSIEIILKRLKQTIGQNDKDATDSIDDDQAVLLKNVITTRKGKMVTRSGCTLTANRVASTAVDGLGHFYPQGGTKVQLALMNGNWYKRQAGDTTWTSIKSGLSTGNRAFHLVANGAIYTWDGNASNNVQSFNGATESDEGNLNTSFPKFKFGIYHQNRGLVGTDTDSLVYFSQALDLSSATGWDRTANVFKFGDKDNGLGRAIVELPLLDNNAWLYFKTNSVWSVNSESTTIANWSRTVLDPIHGCVATRTAVPIGSGELAGGVLYLSKETAENGKNFYRVRSIKRSLYGSHIPGPVMSDDIENTLNNMNPVYEQGCAAYFHNNKFLLAFPSASATYNDTVAVLDLTISNIAEEKFRWSIISGWNPAIFDIFEESSVESLYFGDASANSRVFKGFSGTSDNSTAIDAKVTGRAEDGGYPEINKVWEFVEVYFESTDSSTATVRAIFDNGQPITLGTVTLSSSGPNLPISLPFNLNNPARVIEKFPLDTQICRNVSIEVENDNLDKSMNYLGYVLAGWAENLSFSE